MSDNPYQPPEGEVRDPNPSVSSELNLGEIKKLPAGRGLGWITSAMEYFKGNPGIWIMVFVLLLIIRLALAKIPLLGGAIYVVIAPILNAGVVLIAHEQYKARGIKIEQLFGGFKKNTINLSILGLIYLAAMFAIGICMYFLLLSSGGSMEIFTQLQANDLTEEQALAMMAQLSMPALVGSALFVPLAMAMLLAPPLVMFHDLDPISAIKMSFYGCIHNILPMTVYGLLLVPLAMVATLPFFLGWLILGPIMMISVYVMYREILTEPVATERNDDHYFQA